MISGIVFEIRCEKSAWMSGEVKMPSSPIKFLGSKPSLLKSSLSNSDERWTIHKTAGNSSGVSSLDMFSLDLFDLLKFIDQKIYHSTANIIIC